jgi:hypothetical protein
MLMKFRCPKIKTIQFPVFEDEYKDIIAFKKKLNAKTWREMFGKLIEGDKW